MASGEKRSRGPKWSHEETLVLAELKREASFTKNEGKLVWIEIAQTISNRFPGQTRSHDQCRRRWETLIKVDNDIQKYCLEEGKAHWMLNEDELSSMKLDTAYRRDWYDVVEDVCSRRKRKEKPQGGSMVVKRSKISEPISIQPSSEDKLSLEEEVRLLRGQIEYLNSEVAQLRQASQHQAEIRWEDFNPSDLWDQAMWETLPCTWANEIRCLFLPQSLVTFKIFFFKERHFWKEWSSHFEVSFGVFVESVCHQRHTSQEKITCS